MEINETLRERYQTLGGSITFWAGIIDVVTQDTSEAGSLRLNALVSPQGRYVARASGDARKPRKGGNTEADVLEGETSFIRPNGEEYYGRAWGIHSDVMTLRKAREATALANTKGGASAMYAMLYGAPGCGKTALVEAAFEDTYTLMGTGDTEVADMLGGYIQTPSGGFEWIDGDLVKAAEEGAVYFIDEIGLIDPKVLSIVYGLMDGRRSITVSANPERGTVKAHPNFFVVAATNPNAPGVRLSEALLSRFTIQAEMTTDWSLARKLGVPSSMVTVGQKLSQKQAEGLTSWAPQMRELIAFRDIAGVFGTQFAIGNILASAPEIDRAIVVDLITRAFGEEAKPAKI
jgi:hypothetical protein